MRHTFTVAIEKNEHEQYEAWLHEDISRVRIRATAKGAAVAIATDIGLMVERAELAAA